MTLSEMHPGDMLPVRVVWLTRGQFTIIDPEDFSVIARVKWRAIPRGRTSYAVRTVYGEGKRRTLYLHSFLTGWSYCDHRNGRGLDNRRANLREATHTQNMVNVRLKSSNTSGHAGVRWQNGRWVVTAGGSTGRYVGRFADFDEAVEARHVAMIARYGEFAPRCCG